MKTLYNQVQYLLRKQYESEFEFYIEDSVNKHPSGLSFDEWVDKIIKEL